MPADDVLETRVGEAFEVTLEAVPTSGFGWELELTHGGGIEVVGATEDVTTRPLGSPGVQRFTLRATEVGETELRFVLRRGVGDPVDEHTVRVVAS